MHRTGNGLTRDLSAVVSEATTARSDDVGIVGGWNLRIDASYMARFGWARGIQVGF